MECFPFSDLRIFLLYICIYICVYICVCVCMYIYIYIYIYVYVYIYIFFFCVKADDVIIRLVKTVNERNAEMQKYTPSLICIKMNL